jgi:hypothetical protein
LRDAPQDLDQQELTWRKIAGQYGQLWRGTRRGGESDDDGGREDQHGCPSFDADWPDQSDQVYVGV